MEEQIGLLAEKYGVTSKTLPAVANKFERLIEDTKTTASVLGRNLKGKGEIPSQLLQEARKYKSAEEFVKAQGKPAFHGSDKASIIEKEGFKVMPLQSARGYGDGIYFTETSANAKGYGDVVKSYIPKDLKLYQATEADTYKIDTKRLINEGYDGVKLPGTGGFTIFDTSKIKTKSQLTDIWKKANKKK